MQINIGNCLKIVEALMHAIIALPHTYTEECDKYYWQLKVEHQVHRIYTQIYFFEIKNIISNG